MCFVQYETDSSEVRRLFEEHGEIKTFFDLIANRGMVFVTYVSLTSYVFRLKQGTETAVTYSLIFELLRGQESDCKIWRSVDVP